MGRIVGLFFTSLGLTVLLVVAVALFAWVKVARALPNLQGWHQQWPSSEFSGKDAVDGYSLDDYLEQEERVFAELEGFVDGGWSPQSHGALNRYRRDSICNPATLSDRNWNRSKILLADQPQGGVLLIHGLSDSPYSLRTLGHRLHAEGYSVVWLRVPGHGTCPGALAWPAGMASLSHVAVPIPPDDPVYGAHEATERTGLHLGSLSLRGEPSALLMSPVLFVRCRYNPFYPFMEERVVTWLAEKP